METLTNDLEEAKNRVIASLRAKLKREEAGQPLMCPQYEYNNFCSCACCTIRTEPFRALRALDALLSKLPVGR